MTDTPDPPRSWKRYLPLAVALLLVAGIVVIIIVGHTPSPAPPPPPPPEEEPLPRTPTELLRDLTAATASGNRPRLVRLLTDDWADFVTWADGETRALETAKQKAVDAVRAAVGEEPARLVRELPDIPAAWPLFAGVDWSKATIPNPESPLEAQIVAGPTTFVIERQPDGTWRLRPGPKGTADATKQDVITALGPLFGTYRQLEAMAVANRLSAETFPAVLNSVRQLALVAAHPPGALPGSPPR